MNRINQGLTFIVLLFVCNACQINADNQSLKLTNEARIVDLADLNNDELDEDLMDVRRELINGLTEGTIDGWESKNFEELRSPEDIDEDFSWEEIIEVQPDPDDPYYTVDSVISNQFRPDDIESFKLVHDLKINENNKPELLLKGLAPMFNPLAQGQELSQRELAYTKFDDLSDQISDEKLNKFLTFLIDTEFENNKGLNTGYLIYSNVIPVLKEPEQLFEYNDRVLTGLNNGDLKSFETSKFENELTSEEAGEKLIAEEIIELQPDPDDPYYTVDSVVEIEPKKDGINYSLAYAYEISDGKLTTSAKGIALSCFDIQEYRSCAEDEELVYVSWEDLQSFLGNEDYNEFQRLLVMSVRIEEFFELKK